MLQSLTPPPVRSGRSRTIGRTLATLLAAGAAFGAWHWYAASAASRAAAAAPAETPVPVDVAIAQRQDFPVYLNGIGTVQAWNMVTIRTRVDGQIDKVAFKEGETVHQGDLLLQLDPRPFQAALDQAMAKKALDEAQLANSKRDLVRYMNVGPLAVTQQQIDTQRALVKQQEAQIKSDQAVIDNAKVQLGYTTIRAPITGRMGFRLVDKGNIVHAAEAQGIATIAQLEPIAVIFTAPEEELPRINEALKAGPLQVIAYTSDGKKELDTGTLALVDNQVDIATGSIRLKGKFNNREHKLWPGLSVDTRLRIDTLHNAVVVPDVAVQRGPDGLYAYVVGSDDKVEKRDLKVGPIEDGRAAVTAGISPGECVVTSGYYRLEPGSPIEIRRGGVEDTTASRRSAATPVSVKVE